MNATIVTGHANRWAVIIIELEMIYTDYTSRPSDSIDSVIYRDSKLLSTLG